MMISRGGYLRNRTRGSLAVKEITEGRKSAVSIRREC